MSKPSNNFDLSKFWLTLPDAKASIVKKLSGYEKKPWFFSGSDRQMVFGCPTNGGHTSGSSYPRCELRELSRYPDNKKNWKLAGRHVLTAVCRVTQAPPSQRIIIGQIHAYTGNAYPLWKLYWDRGRLTFDVKRGPADNSDAKYAVGLAALNDAISYQVAATPSSLAVKVNGVELVATLNPAWSDEEFYFKAGCYCIDNAPNGWAQVEFSELIVQHGKPPQQGPPFAK